MMKVRMSAELAALLGELAELVGLANVAREKEFTYTMEYYGAKWIWIRRRPWCFENIVKAEDIVARDTRVTIANMEKAIEIMRKECGSGGDGDSNGD